MVCHGSDDSVEGDTGGRSVDVPLLGVSVFEDLIATFRRDVKSTLTAAAGHAIQSQLSSPMTSAAVARRLVPKPSSHKTPVALASKIAKCAMRTHASMRRCSSNEMKSRDN